MITKICKRILRALQRSAMMSQLRNKRLYPGVSIHASANMDVQGNLVASDGNINSGAQVIIPAGATLALGTDCYIGRYVELGPSGGISIGSHTSIQDRCIILGEVNIGRYCVFAPNIYISSGQHHFDREPAALIKDQDAEAALAVAGDRAAGKVVIEDDCWIGVNAVIMRGVTIGRGAVVGANAVVTRSVEPYTVVAGAPARGLRKRLDFRPPRSIAWDAPSDMPYFYRGFQVSQGERKANQALQGLLADAKFCVALDAGAGEKLCIVARAVGGDGDAILRSGAISHPLGNEFRELFFDIDDPGAFHDFALSAAGPAPRLVVQTVRIATP